MRTVTLWSAALPLVLVGAAHAQTWWPPWAVNPQHTGNVSIAGQALNQTLATIVYDPLVPAEMAANGGELLAHYQVPLLDANAVYMEFKSGNYNKNTYATDGLGRKGLPLAGRQSHPALDFHQ